MDKESNIVVSVNGLKFLTRFFQREFDGIIPDEPADLEKVFTVAQTRSRGLSSLIADGIATDSVSYQNAQNDTFFVFSLTPLGQSLLAEGFRRVRTPEQLSHEELAAMGSPKIRIR